MTDASGKQTGEAQLNPNWASFFKEAMMEAPAVVFMLSKEWVESKWCLEELMW